MALTDHIRKDSPTNNFATLNPLAPDTGDDFAMSEGNLRLYTVTPFSTDGRNISTIPFLPAMGKIYIEVAKTTNAFAFGFSQGSNAFGLYGSTGGNFEVFAGTNANGQLTWQYRSNNGHFPTLNTSATEVIGVLIDFTNSQFKIKLASTDYTYSFSHSSYINFSNTDNILLACTNGGNSGYGNFNFGVDPTFAGYITLSGSYGTYSDANGIGSFFYDPTAIDSGALALCTQNIPTPSIDSVAGNEPEDFFKCLTYSGTGNQQDIAVGFKPDLVWAKSRTQTYSHMLYDTVRGQKHLNSDNTDTEVSDTQLAFHATDGFTVATSSGELNDATGAPNNFAAWCWKAGGAPADGGSSASGSAKIVNEDGTQADTTCDALASEVGAGITPQKITANRKAGFSIVLATGIPVQATVYTMPHGLSKTPELSIFKNVDYNDSFYVRSKFTNSLIALNQTWSENQYQNYWAGGSYTYPLNSNIFSVRGNAFMATTSDKLICYHFHSVTGYSKIGSYIGNGTSAGPFVYTGFRPSFVMIKNTSATADWIIIDSARDEFNSTTGHALYPSLNFTEANLTAYALDLLSNGFKIRNNGTEMNRNGNSDTFIYMAFAEQNFKYTTAR